MVDQRSKDLRERGLGEACGLEILVVPLRHFIGMIGGVFVNLDIGLREPAQRVFVGGEERPIGAEYAARMVRVDSRLSVRDLGEVELLLNRIGPGVEMRREIASPRLTDSPTRSNGTAFQVTSVSGSMPAL